MAGGIFFVVFYLAGNFVPIPALVRISKGSAGNG
jgi:hypothetical protein